MYRYGEPSEGYYSEPATKSRKSFLARALSDGLQDSSDSKHLVILFFALQLYAVYTCFAGSILVAISIAPPSLLLPYTWSFSQHYETILGIPFYYVLPSQGPHYPCGKWSPQHHRNMKGPARDAYANCFYTIPLYLALWYSFVATLLPAHVTFLVLVAVLFISRPEYWFTENIFLGPGPSFLNMLLGLGWQFMVGAFTLFVWTVATLYMRVEVEVGRAHPSRLVVFEEGPALALTCILVIKVINTWRGSRFIWSNLIVSPYHEYWEPSATKEEINIWERLEWQQLQDRQRRREWDSFATEEEISDHNMREVMEYNESRRRRKEPKERIGKQKSGRQQAVHPREKSSRDRYPEESPEPEALYRGSESDEVDGETVNGGENDATAPAENPAAASSQYGVAVGGSIPDHPLPPPYIPYGFRQPGGSGTMGKQTGTKRPGVKRPGANQPVAISPVADPTAPLTADQKYKAQISLRLEAALARNPALTEKLIESQIQGLPAATAARRKASIENRLVQSTQDKIDRQRHIKPRRDSTSIAPVVPYNDDPSPTARTYLSILEDPLAIDPTAPASDDDDTASDVYLAEVRYPNSTFPRRAWRESVIDTFGTSDIIFDRTKSIAYNVSLFLGQAFALAVLARLLLIGAGTWALDTKDGGNLGVLWSTLYMVHLGIGMLYTKYTEVVEYWGRLIRVPVEFLANDVMFVWFLAFCGINVWALWTWVSDG